MWAWQYSPSPIDDVIVTSDWFDQFVGRAERAVVGCGLWGVDSVRVWGIWVVHWRPSVVRFPAVCVVGGGGSINV